MQQVYCDGCGEETHHYDITHYGSTESGYQQLCSRYFSAAVAQVSGQSDFDFARLEPIGIADCEGELHQFHFVTRLLGAIVSLEAFELKDGHPAGYEFEIIGNPEEDLFALLGRMVEKIRKSLSVKHIKDGEYGLQIADMTVRGRIDCDLSEAERMPMIVVDGQEISWEEFGRMVSTFEGWQFKLEFRDRSEEL